MLCCERAKFLDGMIPIATSRSTAPFWSQRWLASAVAFLVPRMLPSLAIRRDESGAVKGDGLVTYLKAPSVDLAVQIIDGTPLRDGLQQLLSVSQARSREFAGPP